MGLKPRVGVIGAGAGGIAMGIQLAAGGYDFTIFDRADGFGGTWRHNTFPYTTLFRSTSALKVAISEPPLPGP